MREETFDLIAVGRAWEGRNAARGFWVDDAAPLDLPFLLNMTTQLGGQVRREGTEGRREGGEMVEAGGRRRVGDTRGKPMAGKEGCKREKENVK